MKPIRRDALVPGDHIYSDRKSRIYYHHGIYVGDDMVIHLMGPSKTYSRPPCKACGFKPQQGLFKTCMDCFLEGHSLFRYEYDVSYTKLLFKRSGTCSIHDAKPAKEVVETAHRLLEEKSFGSYHFLLNNCEDFAVFCKTGVAMSNQAAGTLFGFTLVGAVGYHVTKGIYEVFADDKTTNKNDKTFDLYTPGIYVGDDMVIHLMGPSKVYNRPACQKCGFKPRQGLFKTCLDCFLEGHSLYRYKYDVSYARLLFKRSGTCSIHESKPDQEVVETAHRLLEEQNFGSYHFFLNNCEDFAVFCKTGVKMSNQAAGTLFGFTLVGAVGYHVTKGIYEVFTDE